MKISNYNSTFNPEMIYDAHPISKLMGLLSLALSLCIARMDFKCARKQGKDLCVYIHIQCVCVCVNKGNDNKLN